MLRWFFPKKTDFSQVTQVEVDEAVRLINNKPRKILGYRSSLEVARELGIISGVSVLVRGRI
jgi:transposase, IS30 family